MKMNQLQLMVYGEGLSEISVTATGIEIVSVQTVPNSNYAFVDLKITPTATVGNHPLVFHKGKESVSVNFPILERKNDPQHHQGFGPEDVIYLITPDRFANGNAENDKLANHLNEFNPSAPEKRHGGDLQGIIDNMDYFENLGVTALWLNPILENDGINSYHGYKTTDFYQIDPRFGTNEVYLNLVETAHKRGIKIIFDHINNHIGFRHSWVQSPPMKDWFNGTVEKHLLHKHYKSSVLDPHADPANIAALKDFWFVDLMPDLNQRNPFLATYLTQNMIWWMEYTGLDGIREDTYPYPDQAFMSEWAKTILEEYPQSNIVGEVWALSTPFIAGFQKETYFPREFDTNLPSVMDFPLMKAYRKYMRDEAKLQDIYEVFADDFVYTDLDNVMTFLDNHDVTRAIYDAQGATDRVKQCLAMLLTTRGIPQLFYGTELNMKGGERHIDLREDFPGGFPYHKRSAFAAEGRTAEEADMFTFTRQWLQLRKKYPALSKGKMTQFAPKNGFYSYFKSLEDQEIWVVLNGGDEKQVVDISEMTHRFEDVTALRNLISEENFPMNNSFKLELQPRGVQAFLLMKK
ncbi:UNVERIFIED_CONTAM: hypothetical protein GTU68_027061 [Idotea baltica]|nr:hypothetical protein [Idotea baltica]